MNMTIHATARMQQRGIHPEIVQLLDCYGCRSNDRHGGEIVFFNRKSKQILQRDLPKKEYAALEKKLDAYFVEVDGAIITVGHRYKKVRNH